MVHLTLMRAAGDEMELFGGARLLRLGGHFPGSAVLHWNKGAEGNGILCTGIVLLHCCRSYYPGLTATLLLTFEVQSQITLPMCHTQEASGS